ncbi:hypothetical protein BDM02DRAFT_3113654 [Thelephora ganbajun]|uniref:Uncharacterized protein n=1 Tax=Thelephora ganbajun TaxID=370292 RepID=A0ACB6ZJ26_THEGA|nr:hypothetical protein BDM02DRAFT_3113654 [Thelephora ganbajun]
MAGFPHEPTDDAGAFKYDRYWTGRTAWSEVFCNSRIFSRLMWLRVPPILKSGPEGFKDQEGERTVMVGNAIALGLIQGSTVALKHHLRGEI